MPETAQNENGSAFAGMPPWMRFVATVGIPGAGLAYLVYILATQLPMINARMEAHEKATAQMQQHYEQELDQQWALYGVLQRICLNTAKSDEDKKSCTMITMRPR